MPNVFFFINYTILFVASDTRKSNSNDLNSGICTYMYMYYNVKSCFTNNNVALILQIND